MPLRSRKRSAGALFLVSLFLVAPVLGCSDDDTAATAPSPTPPPAASSPSLTGTWTGESGSTSAPSILEVTQVGDRVQATVTWPGSDRRELYGHVVGSFVEMTMPVTRISGSGQLCFEDLWLIDWDGAVLRGQIIPCDYHGHGSSPYDLDLEQRLPLQFRRQG